ncbi:MAG: arabinogalactan endo-1,4-beta-galactosidase [Oscillospiraceae bacterium]|nr:arabinogalactan endo-1,4-beta-galactosidase [Oscillospiraceae bacterium]
MKKFEMNRNFAVGSDISWYPQMRKSGFVFKNKEGKEQSLLETLKEFNHNAIRLRTWVGPSDDPQRGHCSAQETMEFAVKCHEQGYRIMLNFHYGDTWCDPGKQVKPKAWEGLDFDGLVKAMHDYTYDTVKLLVDNGVVPEWVQIGNEIDPGMMLPDGSTDDFGKLSRLISAGHDATKAASPASKTMVHLAAFANADFCINYFENLEKHECRYDIMGFSFYPWHLNRHRGTTYEEAVASWNRSIKEIPERFGREFQIVEIGGEDVREEESYKLMMDAIESIHSQPLCTGLFWWEPEGARVWSGYPLSAWRADGTPTKAMDAFNAIGY